jgi:hypothetical protein
MSNVSTETQSNLLAMRSYKSNNTGYILSIQNDTFPFQNEGNDTKKRGTEQSKTKTQNGKY